jgi:phosphatidylglycerol:prolipoprotein diacylglycerol transferase
MCQTLLLIPYEFHGVPIFGTGILLALWLIGTVILFGRLVRRGGFDAETRSHILPVVLVGAAIWFLPRLFPGGLPIRGYGVMLLVGAVAGVGLAVYRARQVGLNADLVFSLAFWMFLPGIVGARLFHVIEYWGD